MTQLILSVQRSHMYVRLWQRLQIMTSPAHVWCQVIYFDTKMFVKWIDYTVCLASLVIIVLLVRKLQMGRQKGSLERNSSINSIVLWRLLIQTHTKLSITEKKRNVAKYLTWNSVRLCKFCKKFMKKGTVNFLKKGPKGGLGIFRF